MSDLFREVDEALREDRVKAVWQRYGTLITAAAVILIVGTAASVWWQDYRQDRRAEETAALLAAVEQAQREPETGAAALAALAEEGDAGHAVLARLHEAALLAEQGDTAAAVAAYRALAEDDDVDRQWRDLATLLAALHSLDDGDPAALGAELEPLTAPESPWRFSALELTALLALRQGDETRAAEILTSLSEDPEAPVGVRGRAADLSALLAG